jgi:hypothetical protein
VSSVSPGARLNSETAGRIDDRMSIMALKVHVMRAQTERSDVDTAQLASSRVKLERLPRIARARCRTTASSATAYFSDRGRPFQSDRGR